MIDANDIIEIINMKKLVLQNKQLIDEDRNVVEYNGVREIVYAFIDQPQNARTVIKQVKAQLKKNQDLKNQDLKNEQSKNEQSKNEQLNEQFIKQLNIQANENERLKQENQSLKEKLLMNESKQVFRLTSRTPNLPYINDWYCSASNLEDVKKHIFNYHDVSNFSNEITVSFVNDSSISYSESTMDQIKDQIKKNTCPYTPFSLYYRIDYDRESYIPIYFKTIKNYSEISHLSFIKNNTSFNVNDVIELATKAFTINNNDSVKITAWTGFETVKVQCITDVLALYNLCSKQGQKYIVLKVI